MIVGGGVLVVGKSDFRENPRSDWCCDNCPRSEDSSPRDFCPRKTIVQRHICQRRQFSSWTKVLWTKVSLNKSRLGQMSPWTIAPWTFVATSDLDLDLGFVKTKMSLLSFSIYWKSILHIAVTQYNKQIELSCNEIHFFFIRMWNFGSRFETS